MARSKPFSAEGGCDCRHVRYRMESAPLFVHCCHCRWCQRESGAAFALNAMIEADRVTVLGARAGTDRHAVRQAATADIARCPKCRIAVWSNYAAPARCVRFVRVGTLDAARPAASGHPHLHGIEAAVGRHPARRAGGPEYYDRDKYWPAESLARRQEILPRIEAYQAAAAKRLS